MAEILHLRVVAPAQRRDEVLGAIEASDGVCNVVLLPNASRRPDGDVIMFDVVREAINDVLDQLERLGLVEDGSIAVHHVELMLSATLERAQDELPGDPYETVVWDEVSAKLHQAVRLNVAFLAFFAVAAVIAAVGIMSDSPILIVGAMVVGPEYGPLASMAFGLHRRDGRLVSRGAWCFLVGSAVAIATALVITIVARTTDEIPRLYLDRERPLTEFITHPDAFTLLVAAAAGVAGMLALAQDRAGTLVGVLISVTTIPAIAEVGVGIGTGHWDEVGGALLQLAVNVACLVSVGVLTLALLRRLTPHALDRRHADVHLGPAYDVVGTLRSWRSEQSG